MLAETLDPIITQILRPSCPWRGKMKLSRQQMNKVLSVYMRLIQSPGLFGVIRFCPASLVGESHCYPLLLAGQCSSSDPLPATTAIWPEWRRWGPTPFRHSIKYDWMRDQNKIRICLRIGDYNYQSRRQKLNILNPAHLHTSLWSVKWNTSVLHTGHSAYCTLPTILLWNSI